MRRLGKLAETRIVCGLDIGTTKATAIVADVADPGAIRLLGVGTATSDGLRRGAVVDLERTTTAVSRAVEAAERMAEVPVRSVVAGIAGDHIRSLNSRGVIAVASRDQEIGPGDVARVVEAARAVAIPADREVLHVLPQEYVVDSQRGIREPVGMCGVRLEAEVHIITGSAAAARNLLRAIERAGLRVDDLVLQPLASSRAVLSSDEEDLGVVLLDIGGGTTDIAVFHQGAIRHTAILGLGGSNITADLAIGLRAPIERAERLKLESGFAMGCLAPAGEAVAVPGASGRRSEILRQTLAEMIEPRVEEILTHAWREVRRAQCADFLGSGVVLTGGSAALPGIVELAEEIFGMPARRGNPRPFAEAGVDLEHPMFATAVGLVRYAAAQAAENHRQVESLVDRIGSRLKNLVAEFF